MALIVQNVQLPNQSRPYRALVREPGSGVDHGQPHAFTGGVVLHDDFTPPVDHLFFYVYGTGRGGVDSVLHGAEIVFCTHLFGQL